MAYATTSTLYLLRLSAPDDPLLVSERVAVAAFLAAYFSGTRVSYTTDLRIFAGSLVRHATYIVSTFIAGATPG